jgi:hypothetical protein
MHDILGTFNSFAINQGQDYSTERGLSHLQSREDEIELPAAGHHSLVQYHGGVSQDSFVKNVDEYLQGTTAPAWNPALAAQQSPSTEGDTLQRIQLLAVPNLTTSRKQQIHLVSDSGYHSYQISQHDTRSEHSDRSNSFSHYNNRAQAIPRTIPDQRPMRGTSQGPSDYSMDSSQQTPSHGRAKSDAGATPRTIPCVVEGCLTLSKTQSDLKKHVARHKAEHLCKVNGCRRNTHGFATVNDLDRHLLTVHKQRSKNTIIHRCLAPSCHKPEKDWPRKDNFRSHLKKAHPNEDMEALTKLSEEAWNRRQHGLTSPEDQSMFMGSESPITEDMQRAPRRGVAFYSTSASGSGHAQPTPVPQPRSQPFQYVPRGVQLASEPMPGTIQHDHWQALRRHEVATPLGYQNADHIPTNIRSSGPSSGGFQHSSSVTLPEQHTSHQYRPIGTGHLLPYAHTEINAGIDPFQDWMLAPTPQPAATSMSRTGSFNQPALHVQTHHQIAGQRARTVADIRSLEQERREDMTNFPAYDPLQGANDTEFPWDADNLVGFGSGMLDSNFEGDNPEIRVQQPDSEGMELDQASQDNPGDVNVSNLKKFLERFTAKTDNDPAKVKSVLTDVLLSLGSTTGEASSAASNFGASTDHYIEECSNAGKKSVFRCMWPKCNSSKKEWNLRSEIKKHMKRHSKPYGCTFDKCYRQFGSKSDWIRHETKRHSLQECWRCVLHNPRIAPGLQPCRRLFWSRQQFVTHLGETHKLTKENQPEEFTSQITKQHINNNFQPQYWCGFCKNIIRLPVTAKGKEGIHERCSHVADHITDEGRCMDDWIPAHGILSRGKLRAKFPPRQGQIPDEEDEEDDDDASPLPATSEESNSSNDADQSPPQGTFPAEPPPVQQQQQQRQVRQVMQSQPQPQAQPSHQGQKRSAFAAGLAPSSSRHVLRRANFWHCHACQNENLLATSPACTSCSHQKCSMCSYAYHGEG